MLFSKRGPQGGYTLDAEVAGLTLADIFEMAGQKVDVLPVESGREGHIIDDVLMGVELSMENDIVAKLGRLKVKDLLKKMKEKISEKGLSYMI
jgi:DNA-binding IscR family transcriptional regulator